MIREKAVELLSDATYSARLPMEELRNLLIRAGYSKDIAHKAAMQRGWDRLSAGETI